MSRKFAKDALVVRPSRKALPMPRWPAENTGIASSAASRAAAIGGIAAWASPESRAVFCRAADVLFTRFFSEAEILALLQPIYEAAVANDRLASPKGA